MTRRIHQKYRHNNPCADPPTRPLPTHRTRTTHTQTHTAPSECSACSTATNQVYGRRKRRTFVRKWSIYLLVFAHYLNPFFSLYSQILCPILTAINDKCYDTIKPSRLHITAAIKAMILSTTSIRCALVIPASCYSARTRIPNQNVYPLYPVFVYMCVCVCATGMESVCAARIQQERRTSIHATEIQWRARYDVRFRTFTLLILNIFMEGTR